jgi:hypothetical protein
MRSRGKGSLLLCSMMRLNPLWVTAARSKIYPTYKVLNLSTARLSASPQRPDRPSIRGVGEDGHALARNLRGRCGTVTVSF